MNVNLLQDGGPAWQWYFVVVVPFSMIVILVWIFCKYLPVRCLSMLPIYHTISDRTGV